MTKRDSRTIFIVGSSRSGTTLLARVLGSHPDTYCFPELHYFEGVVGASELDQQPLKLSQNDLEKIWSRLFHRARAGVFVKENLADFSSDVTRARSSANEESYFTLLQSFLQYETEKNRCSIAIEQTPRNLFYAKVLLEQLPNCRVINLVRDPRDVMLSQKKKWRRRYLGAVSIPLSEAVRSWFNYSPWTVAAIWKAAICAAQSIKSDRFYSLNFERLISEPERELTKLLAFLDLELDQSMLRPEQIGSSSADDKKTRGFDIGKSGNWHLGGLSKSELYICELICSKQMGSAGYVSSATKLSTIGLIYQFGLFAIKAPFVVWLNRKRFKGLMSSTRRRLDGF